MKLVGSGGLVDWPAALARTKTQAGCKAQPMCGGLAITCKYMYNDRCSLGMPSVTASMAVQAVGDALSGVLMVEAGLRRRQWGLGQWAELYQDLPSRQTKVLVADRSVISTINAETQVASPAGLQALIDQAVAGQHSFSTMALSATHNKM